MKKISAATVADSGEMLFYYACIFVVLLLAMAVLLLYKRSGSNVFPPQPDWRAMFARCKEKVPAGEFWLKIFIAAFTALAVGVIIVVFVLPYGTVPALGAIVIVVASDVYDDQLSCFCVAVMSSSAISSYGQGRPRLRN